MIFLKIKELDDIKILKQIKYKSGNKYNVADITVIMGFIAQHTNKQ